MLVILTRKSEKAVLIIGSINVLLLFIASFMSKTGNVADAGGLMLIFVHIIIIIGAFPILYRAVVSSYSVSKNFTVIFTVIALLSALLVLLAGSVTVTRFDSDDYIFITLGLIELLPIMWLNNKKRDRIWQEPKKLPFEIT